MASLTIHRGGLDPGHYVWSPFVTKLEARLRFASVPYKTTAGSLKAAPKGKIPYIEIAEEIGPSSTIGDLTLITKHLVERGTLPDLNASLSPSERAHDLAIWALLKDKCYFCNVWLANDGRKTTIPCGITFLGAIPYPARIVVGFLIYRSTVQTLHGQGTGRYTDEEVQGFRSELWTAVNDLLVASRAKKAANLAEFKEKLFWVLGGEEQSEADAAVFGFVVSGLLCDAGPKRRELVKGFTVVVEYARRIHDTFFPDYELWAE